MKETSGKAPGMWRALTGVLLSGATLMCGMTGTAIAHADENLGDYVKIESATQMKTTNDYKGNNFFLEPNGKDKPVEFAADDGDSSLWGTAWGNGTSDEYGGFSSVSFVNKATEWNLRGGNLEAGTKAFATDHGKAFGGWESIRVVPAGGGTVALKDPYKDAFFAVASEKVDKDTTVNYLVSLKRPTNADDAKEVPDDGHFIIHTDKAPAAPTDLKVSSPSDTTAVVSFTEPEKSIVSDYEVTATPTDSSKKTVTVTSPASKITVQGLTPNTGYTITVKSLNGSSPASKSSASVSTKTLQQGLVGAPETVSATKDGNGIKVTWSAVKDAGSYKVYRAKSAYAKDSDFKALNNGNAVTDTSFTDNAPDADQYANYYKVVALNKAGEAPTELPDTTGSLDESLFGDHTLVFAPTDDMTKVDQVLSDLFIKQNDIGADAQFKSDHWQLYFKPGSYVDDAGNMISNINVGFYTSLNGLGKLPTDTMINNVSTSSYLKSSYDWALQGNATCNFWRAIENIGVKNTEKTDSNGNVIAHVEKGHAGNAKFGPNDQRNPHLNEASRPDYMNWGVAQAAPMRRVWTNRPVAYDWNYGWASGGYVADSQFDGVDPNKTVKENGKEYPNPVSKQNISAGTWSGQQFYTRNSAFKGKAFGTTLNNFLQGVTAPDLPKADGGKTGNALIGPDGKTNGASNWGVQGEQSTGKDEGNNTKRDADGNPLPVKDLSGNTMYDQQVTTAIDSTDEVAEKPFVYLDEASHEYKVFVPSMEKNTSGTSWGEGKENGGMGAGKSLSLTDDFYIARPNDKDRNRDVAGEINDAIAKKKNVYLTPGIYHVKEAVNINTDDVIVLGSGMATIIPDNEDAAVRVADGVKGAHVAGLVLDAGSYSKYLMQVGTTKTAGDAADPIELQDIFFRIGGTTDSLTKADIGIEINTGNTITDHFWIWRADHGAGVKWGDAGNYAKNGIIVNGDNVTAYALFDEHFEEYDVLWNGENGKTYFLQNEKCYDPIAQDKWMSHNGTVNGYSAYKVANNVKNHYAVGLGIYDVFIYTGPEYNGMTKIDLDNPIEVPNSPNVIIENAATQSFADLPGGWNNISPERSFKHIINGVGAPVASGAGLTSWSRKFLLSYRGNKNNAYGTAVYGKDPGRGEVVRQSKFFGTEEDTKVRQFGEEVDRTDLPALKEQVSKAEPLVKDTKYTAESREALQTALTKGQTLATNLEDTDYLKYDAKATDAQEIIPDAKAIEEGIANLKLAGADYSKLDAAIKTAGEKKEADYSADSWKNLTEALDEAKQVNRDLTADQQPTVDAATTKLEKAIKALVPKVNVKVTSVDIIPGTATLRIGETKELNALVQPGDAVDKSVTWTSSNPDIATVDANGTVTAKAVGEVTITATANDGSGKFGTAKITITNDKVPVQSIDIIGKTVITAGDSTTLQAVVQPGNAGDRTVSWSSSNPDIATVDANGTVTAKAAGKVTITATANDGSKKTGTLELTVRPIECKPLKFLDVTSGTPHREDIDWLSCSGITTGFHDEANDTYTFKPMNTVVRQDMAAFLYRLAGSPAYKPSAEDKAKFTDVDESTPHAREIWWLAHEGISTGWENGDGTYSFRPMNTVVRQDMAAFLHKLAVRESADPSTDKVVRFTDVNDKTPHQEDIEWLGRTGVSTGWWKDEANGVAEFRGMNEVVRQDMAAFLHRMDANVLHPAK